MSEPHTNSRKTGYLIFAGVLVLAAIGVMAYIRFFLTGLQATDDAMVAGDQTVVSAEVLGRIASLSVAEGDSVVKGQVLIKLDDSMLKAQERQAAVNAEYASRNVALSHVKLDQAQEDFDRASVQLQRKIIPQEQFDHVKQALAAAKASFDIALSQEKLAAAQVETVETSLAHTIIGAPFSGVVAKKWAMPGDVVQPAQSVYTIYDLTDLWIEAYFKETQLRHIRVGDPATIQVDAFPGRVFAGKVSIIGASTASAFALIPQDNGSGNFTKVTQRVPARISIEGDEGSSEVAGQKLLPGMSAEVKVKTGKD